MQLFRKKHNLMQMCNLIILVTVIYGLSQLIYLIINMIQNGFTNFLTLDIIDKNNNALAVIALSIMFLLLVRNVKRGNIFTVENENILMIFGKIIGFIAVVLMLLVVFFTSASLPNSLILTVLLALALVFFSLIMKIGRQFREENEMTI